MDPRVLSGQNVRGRHAFRKSSSLFGQPPDRPTTDALSLRDSDALLSKNRSKGRSDLRFFHRGLIGRCRRRPKGPKQDWMLRSVGGGDFFLLRLCGEAENPCLVRPRIRQREGSSRKTIVMASTFLHLPRRSLAELREFVQGSSQPGSYFAVPQCALCRHRRLPPTAKMRCISSGRRRRRRLAKDE